MQVMPVSWSSGRRIMTEKLGEDRQSAEESACSQRLRLTRAGGHSAGQTQGGWGDAGDEERDDFLDVIFVANLQPWRGAVTGGAEKMQSKLSEIFDRDGSAFLESKKHEVESWLVLRCLFSKHNVCAMYEAGKD